MRRILPILLAAAVYGIAATSGYLTPLYPIYATSDTATSPASLKREKIIEFKEKALEKGDRIETLRDKIASRAAQLKEKLAKFKDKVKATRVEKINNNLNTINEKRTKQMEEALLRISKILDKLKIKSEEATTAGKNAIAISDAIKEAEKAWTEADVALKAQMGKDYSIVVNTESTVKTDASTARDSLRSDLKAVHDQLVKTRQALADAIKTALSAFGGGNKDGSN